MIRLFNAKQRTKPNDFINYKFASFGSNSIFYYNSRDCGNGLFYSRSNYSALAIELQCMRENLTDAEREIKLAEIKQNPNAIIIGYKDKPRKTRRNPNITIQGANYE